MNNKDNKVFCISPWIHLHTWPNEKVYPCCLTPYKFPIGDLKEESLKEVWNGEFMRTLRLNMINGIKSESCRRCYAFEEAGQTSMRNTLNERYKHHINEVNKTKDDGSYENLNLVYWDFRFSNICNFKCRMCGPQLSTGWYEDTKKIYNALPVDIPGETNPDKLWKQIEPFFETVEEIYFAGGEPLIMEEHYRILKKLDEMKRYDVRIRYNSNFSQLKYKSLNVLDIWPKFKSVEMYASIDGSHERGEFIRKGLDWNKFLKNRQLLKDNAPNVRFSINYTLTVLNAFHSTDFHHEMVKNNIIDNANNFRINLAVDPQHLSVQILPNSYKKQLELKITNYINEFLDKDDGFARSNFESLISFLFADDKTNLLTEFDKHMSKIDIIRNENWKTTFPEIAGIINE
jgi:radical SAM protein with 4Fe4S-binding SPASM domain